MSTPTKEEIDFSAIVGTQFSLSVGVEYLQVLQGVCAERNEKYIRNKAREAENACNAVISQLDRRLFKILNVEQADITRAAIEDHKNTIYQFFQLDANDQKRLKSLMNKIQKEKI